jgi:hypothetical protein
MNQLNSIPMSEQKEYKRWTTSFEDKGIRTEYTVREVENGYVIDIYKSWTEQDCFKSESKCYISKNNPMKDPTKFTEIVEAFSSILDGIEDL